MQTLHHAIVSEEMVWLWYYDDLGNKHIKELLAKDAREFVKNAGVKSSEANSKINIVKDAVQIGTDFIPGSAQAGI